MASFHMYRYNYLCDFFTILIRSYKILVKLLLFRLFIFLFSQFFSKFVPDFSYEISKRQIGSYATELPP